MSETPKTDSEQAPESGEDNAAEETPAVETAAEAGDGDPPDADPGADAEAAPGAEQPDLEKEVADLNDKLLRALAETENVRRRAERDKQDASKYAIANFAREMLTVADNLGRAMESVDADVRKNDPAVDQVMVGLEMTQRGILATFERFGITPIEAMGRKFDHNVHEAMFEIDDPEKPAGTVVQVMETGYMLADRLLRPAKVGVSKGGPKATEETAAGNGGDKAGVAPETPAKEGKTAYERKGADPGARFDEKL